MVMISTQDDEGNKEKAYQQCRHWHGVGEELLQLRVQIIMEQTTPLHLYMAV